MHIDIYVLFTRTLLLMWAINDLDLMNVMRQELMHADRCYWPQLLNLETFPNSWFWDRWGSPSCAKAILGRRQPNFTNSKHGHYVKNCVYFRLNIIFATMNKSCRIVLMVVVMMATTGYTWPSPSHMSPSVSVGARTRSLNDHQWITLSVILHREQTCLSTQILIFIS